MTAIMATFQITHHRPDGFDVDRRLEGLYGPECGYLDIDAILRLMDQGHRFWTVAQGRSVWLMSAVSQRLRRFVKTEADGFVPNNLLALPVF
ncbi:MAG: hypothetical protein JNK30_18395 [Phenylobacterium sp.]|uniref:DUF3892 domain-containing protein n=1 Tax=Phenylobacterium sp. TaxID=1871053 RepID=UPI001A522EBB|nr:DUF3892 domain-containing protein [Phenylobacterium sp.]MBL8773360.1 hypothetical protein [Phenylobacterium sp.]